MHDAIQRWLSLRQVFRMPPHIFDGGIFGSYEETYPNLGVSTSTLTYPRASSPAKRPGARFINIPSDVFINICEWLTVRDILSLRMTSRQMALFYTKIPDVWFRKLRRLYVPLPILPATSRHYFGVISPDKYEWLMRRSLYLELNWRRPHPAGALSRFNAFGRPITLKMLPGGKYMVSVIQIGGEYGPPSEMEDPCRVYALVVWDLDHNGLRVPLSSARTNKPFFNLDVSFGRIRGDISIIIAYSTWSSDQERKKTAIIVFSVTIRTLENYGDLYMDESLRHQCDELYRNAFYVISASETPHPVSALHLAQMEHDMVLMILHRPKTLVFRFLNSTQDSIMYLGPVHPYDTLPHAVWALKLLPGQNSVLVAQVIMEAGMEDYRSTLFALDIYILPEPGETLVHPGSVSTQVLGGLEIDGVYISSLENSWFGAIYNAEDLLPAPANRKPPPISCYITFRNPRGFVHGMLAPQRVKNQYITLPNNRGRVSRYVYSLPMEKVERHTWHDVHTRAVFCPGAYRSIVLLRPHVERQLTVSGLGGAPPILRFMLHTNSAFRKFATPSTTGHPEIDNQSLKADAMDVDDEAETAMNYEADLPLDKRTLRTSDQPYDFAEDMRQGTTAVAFDESVGRMVVATPCEDRDKMIQVLDFGGQNWEVGRVE